MSERHRPTSPTGERPRHAQGFSESTGIAPRRARGGLRGCARRSRCISYVEPWLFSRCLHPPEADPMPHDEVGSITHWLAQLKEGNAEAVQPLWDRYFSRLVRLAGKKLCASRQPLADEDE